MSTAAKTFEQSIQDAENLLRHFDRLNTQPPPPENEVLKRAGLIMAMTAWETYVEDRLEEAASSRVARLNDPVIADFVRSKLEEEIRRLHNPNSAKTLELFQNYAGADLSRGRSWENKDHAAVRENLDAYVKLRGDVVHRSRRVRPGSPQPDPVKREDLERVIRYFKRLVYATESVLGNA